MTRQSSKNTRTKKTKRPTSFHAPGPLPMPREMLTVGVELDPQREVERQLRAEELKARLLKMVAEGKGADAIDQVMDVILSMDQDADRMAWRLLRALRYRFGSSSEKLSREELQQLFLAFGGEKDEAADEPPVPAPEEPEQVDEPGASESAGEPPSNTTTEPPKEEASAGALDADCAERGAGGARRSGSRRRTCLRGLSEGDAGV